MPVILRVRYLLRLALPVRRIRSDTTEALQVSLDWRKLSVLHHF